MNDTLPENIKRLHRRLGPRLIVETASYPDYARDASEIRVTPAALFFAETINDVTDIIDACRELNIPVVFRGAGTGYTGGAVPSAGALVLSLERMIGIRIDPGARVGYCGPGVITADLMKAAAAHGLFYPPDPASYEESTLGGNVAENAGGLHCKKYGVTRDYIIGLKAVTADGQLLTTGIYSGDELFDLTGILIGSEGLLAAVTEIAVRLIPPVENGPTILAVFERPEDAARVVAGITARGIIPAVMEYMDREAVAFSNRFEKSPDIDAGGTLLLLETSGINRETEAEAIIAICGEISEARVRVEKDRTLADRLWRVRRNISNAIKESVPYKIAEDVCVPPSRLPELVAFVARLNDELSFPVNSYGHAGDGNLHVNFLPESEAHLNSGLVDRAVERLFRRTLDLGGTLTGEHGIGLTKKDYLPLEFAPPTLAAMKLVKAAFDSSGLFNPGKMF